MSDDESISDRDAIAQLVARFDDAVNRRDPKEFRRLWATDAIWEIGDPMPAHFKGADEITRSWVAAVDGTEWLFRGSFAGVVEISGNTATGRWPCIETGTFRGGKGYDNRALYEDRYIKIDGQWFFAHRRYLYLWLSQEQLPGGPVKLGSELFEDPAAG